MKRKIFAICVVCALLSVAVVGTLAYFTDKSEATINTFTFGNVEIKFEEKNWEEPDAAQPGMKYAKDPTITNVGELEAWIRFDVTLSDLAALKGAVASHPDKLTTDFTSMFGGLDSNFKLAKTTENTTADTVTYTYYYKNKLAKNQSATLFTDVTIPECFDNNDIDAIGDEFTITITGYAVQADGFTTVDEAFTTVTEFE